MFSFFKRLNGFLNRRYYLAKLNYDLNNKIIAQNNELIWAHRFHDSLRGKKELETLSLKVGYWAGNYSFFFILHRILSDFKPVNILEFGLGESSKFISTYLKNYSLLNSLHIIIEHDQAWKDNFTFNFELPKNSQVHVCPLVVKEYEGYKVNVYRNFNSINFNKQFQLFVVDGPIGSERFSRMDILSQVEKFPKDHEFILLFDDFHRQGGKDTIVLLLELLKQKGIHVFQKVYSGEKSQLVIATKKFKNAINL